MARETEIRKAYHLQLAQLGDEILTMGSMVDKALERSMDALARRDVDQARQVVSDDTFINAKRMGIEDGAVILLATQQPMASDLRFITSVEHIATDLERMGDHARSISRLCVKLCAEPPMRSVNEFPRMIASCRERLRLALDAFIQRDADKALACARKDSELDELQDDVYDLMLSTMEKDGSTIVRATYLLWIAHNLERVGDHITNVCERVIYLAKGRREELDEE
ncbi:MAG: phosphate signaling complex protein PhoU [Chloroflexi bacterium]|nr:phosphate signaling complex protein PhoU [Chloroflexota bacterium]